MNKELTRKEEVFEILEELFSLFGEPELFSSYLDGMIFGYIDLACVRGDVMSAYDWDIVYTMKGVRDAFVKMSKIVDDNEKD